MEHSESGKRLLPPNAYRKLEAGEKYVPIVPAPKSMAEVTPWSITLGLIMVVIFTAACVYIALRAGSGIEAAIPIAVAAIFFGKMRKVRSTILENVIVQSVGQASGVVAAGAAFTIPAMYIIFFKDDQGNILPQLTPSWWHIFLSAMVGGALGVGLIIPLRKYFVKDRHGELPFPEATAATEILVSGESSGSGSGKILLASFGLGAAYDFLVEGIKAWNPEITTRTLFREAGDWLYSFRIELKLNAIAALFGLGYIIGLKYAMIIMAGSVLAYTVLVPVLYIFLNQMDAVSFLGATLLGNDGQVLPGSAMDAAYIFAKFVKPIGIGAIATAGVIGLIRMRSIILGSLSLGFKGIGKKILKEEERTQVDMRPGNVLLVQLLTTLLLGLLFFLVCVLQGYSSGQSLVYSAVGMGISFLLCFLFTPVAAEAIAIVGTNPVSGMTLVTVVTASLVMAGMGLFGPSGAFVVLIVGCAVCTALSVAGALISDFKLGYWIGATPRAQQRWKFVGIALAALVVAFVIPLMDEAYHFLIMVPGQDPMPNEKVLPAPQASMIAAVVKGLMSGGQQPYLLYGVGAIMSILVAMAGIPVLAFALGMYMPIGINFAVMAGGFVSYLVSRSSKNPEVNEARNNQGTLVASGMIAGAAIIGIVTAVLRLDWTGYAVQYLSVGESYEVVTDPTTGVALLTGTAAEWFEGFTGQAISMGMFILLGVATFLLARWGAKMDMAGSDKK